jgi:hypothetical protein
MLVSDDELDAERLEVRLRELFPFEDIPAGCAD